MSRDRRLVDERRLAEVLGIGPAVDPDLLRADLDAVVDGRLADQEPPAPGAASSTS